MAGKGAAQKYRVRHALHFKHTMEFLKLGNAKIRPENMVLRATRDAWNIRVCEGSCGRVAVPHTLPNSILRNSKNTRQNMRLHAKGLRVRVKASAAGTRGVI